VIFFDTSGATEDIWYWEQPKPEGRRRYSKTQPLEYDEFQDCLEWWHTRKEGPHAWKVHAADLIERDSGNRVIAVNLDIKNPHAKEVIDHRSPKAIVDSAISKERQVLEILDEIKVLVEQQP
jgi:type I restriction enzyme M protein